MLHSVDRLMCVKLKILKKIAQNSSLFDGLEESLWQGMSTSGARNALISTRVQLLLIRFLTCGKQGSYLHLAPCMFVFIRRK